MKTLLFIDTSIIIENCDSNVRLNQYKEGLTNILKHNNYFSENNIDILLVDNTIDSYLDVSYCDFFNVITKNCNCVTYKNNNYGKKNKVDGCASQVWLIIKEEEVNKETVLELKADSDSFLVKGLLTIIISIFSGKTPSNILKINYNNELEKLNLKENISQQRSNGLTAVINKVISEAQKRV